MLRIMSIPSWWWVYGTAQVSREGASIIGIKDLERQGGHPRVARAAGANDRALTVRAALGWCRRPASSFGPVGPRVQA